MERLATEGDVAEELTELVDSFFEGKPDRGVWYGLLVKAQSDPNLRAALREDWREDARTLRAFLQNLKTNGRLKSDLDLETLTVLLVSVLEHAAGMYLLGFDAREVRKSLLKALRTLLGS
jgi:hypothetical protein